MEEEILKSILLRSGTQGKEELIKDMIRDCVMELRNHLNYRGNDELPVTCIPMIKQMVLIKFNQDGVEGISSEGNSGVSTSYLTDLPPGIKSQIRRYRKLPR